MSSLDTDVIVNGQKIEPTDPIKEARFIRDHAFEVSQSVGRLVVYVDRLEQVLTAIYADCIVNVGRFHQDPAALLEGGEAPESIPFARVIEFMERWKKKIAESGALDSPAQKRRSAAVEKAFETLKLYNIGADGQAAIRILQDYVKDNVLVDEIRHPTRPEEKPVPPGSFGTGA